MKVKGSELGPVVRQFLLMHDVNRPLHASQGTVRGNEYIRTRSGVGADSMKEIIEGKREFWDFSVADKILCAIDRQDALTNGEINIYPSGKEFQIKSGRLCACGCGELTAIITKSRKSFGLIKGEPRMYIKGHHNKMRSKA